MVCSQERSSSTGLFMFTKDLARDLQGTGRVRFTEERLERFCCTSGRRTVNVCVMAAAVGGLVALEKGIYHKCGSCPAGGSPVEQTETVMAVCDAALYSDTAAEVSFTEHAKDYGSPRC